MKSTNLIYSFIFLTFFLAYGSQSLTAQIRARHHLTAQAYQDYFNQMDKAGYQIQCVTGYTLNGVPRFAGIWKKQSGAKPIARHNLNSSAYQAAFDSYSKKGYRLKMLSGYEVGNRAHFAAIWEKNNGKVWAAAHNMTASQYQKKFDDMVKLKYYPLM